MKAIDIIRILSNLSIGLPLVLYIFRRSEQPKQNHIIGLLLVVYAVLDGIGYFLFEKKQSTALIFNLGHFLQFLLIAWFYYEVAFRTYRQVIFKVLVLTFIAFFLFDTIFIEGLNVYQSLTWSVSALVCVIFAVIYFNFLVLQPPILDRDLHSKLAMNSAILFYFSFNFFLFITSNYLLSELTPDLNSMIWSFHNVNNIIKNIAFAFGFYYAGRRVINVTQKELELLKNLK